MICETGGSACQGITKDAKKIAYGYKKDSFYSFCESILFWNSPDQMSPFSIVYEIQGTCLLFETYPCKFKFISDFFFVIDNRSCN